MKSVRSVLHISTYDGCGGAAVAASRLSQGLNNYRYASLFSSVYSSCSLKAHSPLFTCCQKARHALNRLLLAPAHPTKYYRSLAFLPTYHSERINQSNYDVVHFHWFCDNFISLYDLPSITKPKVFTLHDSWFFMGIDHVPDGYLQNSPKSYRLIRYLSYRYYTAAQDC